MTQVNKSKFRNKTPENVRLNGIHSMEGELVFWYQQGHFIEVVDRS